MRFHVLEGSHNYSKDKWGSNFTMRGLHFTDAYWRDLHFVLYSRFTPYFVKGTQFDACIYFGPPTWLRRQKCADVPTCPSEKLTLYIEEATDADHGAYRICSNMWSFPCDTRFLRITGGLPGRMVKDARLASCRSVEVPWLSHIRDPVPFPDMTRPNRVCLASGLAGHYVANSLGFTEWRKRLLEACRGDKGCHTHPTTLGKGPIQQILRFYSQCEMCVQPPGDMLVRPGIVDAISVGCVPVLLHPTQRDYWPMFWNATESTLFVNMQVHNASSVLDRLHRVSDNELLGIRRVGRVTIPRLTYSQGDDPHDAFSHLVSIVSRVL